MKRIAILGRGVHTLPSYRLLINRLAKDYEITVYSEVPCHPEWKNLPHNYKLKCVKGAQFNRYISTLRLLLLVLLDHFKNHYSFIHAHSTYPAGFVAILIKTLTGTPVLLGLDGGEATVIPSVNFGDLISNRRKRLNTWVINNADVVTTLTRFQRDEVIRNLSVKRDILVIPRGVSIPTQIKRKALKPPFVLLNVAYLSPVKDPFMLLKSFSLIRQKVEAVLIHVGEDYMNGAVQRMADELGISDNVKFMGHVPYEQIHRFYSEADVLIMTSLFESQAVVVAEALATGTLVCGTHVGLMADLSMKCCITVPIGDSASLASAVVDLLENESLREQLRQQGIRWSQENNLERTAEKMIETYESYSRKN